MKTYRFLLFSLLIGILVISLSLFLWSRAEANRQTLPQAFNEQSAVSHSQEDHQEPINIHGNVETTFEDVIQEEEALQLDAITIASELKQRIPDINPIPGWIYQEEEHIGNTGMQSPQRGDYPEHYYRVGWYYVNEDGMIDKSVELDKGIDGELFQVTVNVNGYSWNSFFGEVRETKPFPAGNLFNDNALIDWIVSRTESSLSVFLENSDTDATYIFVLEEVLEREPLNLIDIGEPITGNITEYHVDVATGFMKRFAGGVILESDGSRKMRHEINYKRVIDAQPPQEIFDLIEKYGVEN
jgi:hypothetical protein